MWGVKMSKLYSTGPMENAGQQSSNVFVKLLNNRNSHTAEVQITVFALDGTKTPVYTDIVQINPHSSGFKVYNVSSLLEFEVQIKVIRGNILIGIFGEDSTGRLVAAHRLVNSELTVLD